MQPGAALSDLRVLEYGNFVSGPFCARLLADAGADCVKVEPPGGDESRTRGPFPGDVADPDRSGLYLYLNANKLGITLDLESPQDREVFRGLVKQADVLVVNRRPHDLERLELRRHHLEDLNPRLIVTCITPFGLTGPYRDYAGDDLIAVASGGLMYATPGLPDMVNCPDREPPLRANTHVGDFVAGIHATIATLVAVAQRDLTGEGCEVDLSQQAAVAMAMMWEIGHASYLEPRRREPTVFASMPNSYLPCSDGYVVVVGFMDHHWGRLVELIGTPELADMEVFSGPHERARNWDALRPMLLEWTMNHTGEEIGRMAQAKGVPCFPAYRVGQMVESKHVRARGYLQDYGQQDGISVLLPSNPIRMQGTLPSLRFPAPRLGQPSDGVLERWLGRSAREPAGPTGPRATLENA